jgi:hypothetical protein
MRGLVPFLQKASTWPTSERNKVIAAVVGATAAVSWVLTELPRVDNGALRRKTEEINRELAKNAPSFRVH